jgi:Tfp pilus assembly protein PilF
MMSALKEFAMRYYPAAVALSLLVAVTASMGQAGDYTADPRAAALVSQGRSLLEAGKITEAIDSFEAALAVDPGYTDVYLDLAEASRREGMQGKAIHYYRVALETQPENLAAISGEGEALVEKGAVEKAKRNLTKLETMCGDKCAETQALASAIENVPAAKVVTAEAVTPDPVVTQN